MQNANYYYPTAERIKKMCVFQLLDSFRTSDDNHKKKTHHQQKHCHDITRICKILCKHKTEKIIKKTANEKLLLKYHNRRRKLIFCMLFFYSCLILFGISSIDAWRTVTAMFALHTNGCRTSVTNDPLYGSYTSKAFENRNAHASSWILVSKQHAAAVSTACTFRMVDSGAKGTDYQCGSDNETKRENRV